MSNVIDSLVRLCMAAALNVEEWPQVLEELARATHSSHGQMVGYGDKGLRPFNVLTGKSQDDIARFAEIDDGSPGNNFRIAASLVAPPRAIVTEVDYEKARQGLNSASYTDACHDFDIPFGMQTKLLSRKGSLVGLSVLRSRADGVSGEADQEIFANVGPAFRAATQLQLMLEHRGAQLLTGSLAAMNICAFIFDGYGRMAAMTPEAEALLLRDPRLHLADQRFSGFTAASRAIHAKLTTVCSRNAAHGTVDFMAAFADSGLPALKATIAQLPQSEWSFGFEPKAILKLKPVLTPPANLELLREAFGFTAAEAEVAALLFQDMSRQEIAAARGVSFTTVDTQFRSIYAKADVARESSLLARLRDVLD